MLVNVEVMTNFCYNLLRLSTMIAFPKYIRVASFRGPAQLSVAISMEKQ